MLVDRQWITTYAYSNNFSDLISKGSKVTVTHKTEKHRFSTIPLGHYHFTHLSREPPRLSTDHHKPYIASRVRTILALGYWVLGNIHRYWIVVIGRFLLLFCHPIQYQSDSSQHRPHASERLFSSTCDLYSDRCNHLSGHHADMLLFLKHNHCHHNRVLGFFVVIAMLYTSISIGIGYWYRYRPILLDIGCLSWYRSNPNCARNWSVCATLVLLLQQLYIHQIYVMCLWRHMHSGIDQWLFKVTKGHQFWNRLKACMIQYNTIQ